MVTEKVIDTSETDWQCLAIFVTVYRTAKAKARS